MERDNYSDDGADDGFYNVEIPRNGRRILEGIPSLEHVSDQPG